MSEYTDREHKRVLLETLHWQTHEPITIKEQYAYGAYQYRLYDYKEAVKWFSLAAKENSIPAIYKLAYCAQYGLGMKRDEKQAENLFLKVLEVPENVEDLEQSYRIGMCFAYGYGVEADARRAVKYFRQAENFPEALYQIGLMHRDGRVGAKMDKQAAAEYFRKAYDGFCEEAIFALFALFEGDFAAFPYVREIKEAYSFKLGRLLRAAELDPCSEYLVRLGDFYRQGYPGDGPIGFKKFQCLAEKYYKAAEILA
jgi:TPR repeat protein